MNILIKKLNVFNYYRFDNAQRLKETGLGVRIETYTFTDDELINAVETILNDQKMKERLQVAAKRIQASNRHQELVNKVEELIAKK